MTTTESEQTPAARDSMTTRVAGAYETARDGASSAVQSAASGIESNPIAALLGGLALGAAAGVLIARSERALTALRDLSQPLARVLRGGEERQIPARDLVPGDLLLTGEGERLPADARLIAGEVLAVDESALTGESAPVTKPPATDGEPPVDPTPGVDGAPDLFAGTLVVRGHAMVEGP